MYVCVYTHGFNPAEESESEGGDEEEVAAQKA